MLGGGGREGGHPGEGAGEGDTQMWRTGHGDLRSFGEFCSTQQLDFVDTVCNWGLTITAKEELLISIKYKAYLLAGGLKSSQ